jgi:hypothetical protein
VGQSIIQEEEEIGRIKRKGERRKWRKGRKEVFTNRRTVPHA